MCSITHSDSLATGLTDKEYNRLSAGHWLRPYVTEHDLTVTQSGMPTFQSWAGKVTNKLAMAHGMIIRAISGLDYTISKLVNYFQHVIKPKHYEACSETRRHCPNTGRQTA